LHERGLIHSNVRPPNVCSDLCHPSRVFLIDFGNANRYTDLDGNHLEYKVKEKRKHRTPRVYGSVDAHAGALPTRRSDLEMLFYTYLSLLAVRVPWDAAKSPPLPTPGLTAPKLTAPSQRLPI
jgi:vaccinia related kinase